MADGSGRLAGKVAVITGAASGIGAETARRMAAQGARLVLTDLNAEAGEALARSLGADAIFLAQDITDEARWLEVVQAAVDRFGRIDVLVNSAGVAGGSPLMEMTLEEWRRVMSVNADGVFLGMRACAPVMAEKGGGSIVNLSSILGKVGQGGAAHYCASKGAVLLLTKAAALEWAPVGIRVNSVHPGYIETPMVAGALHDAENGNELRDLIISRHALGRMGIAREIADGIVFLASDEASFMTGAELVIDGGYLAQ
ncbi:MAG TPA: glucose 1-dehydrogenase [Caulobacteraceae bacterium]|nr:glucose 1-dehydrogenase [Caulobacteraceae bacterium]